MPSSESTFSRAFEKFAEARLAERVHEALVKDHLGDELIDHNPRRGQKIEFAPAEAIRYSERTAAERCNGRLKDEFGGNTLMVKGDVKAMGRLMFGVLALSADPLLRLRSGRWQRRPAAHA